MSDPARDPVLGHAPASPYSPQSKHTLSASQGLSLRVSTTPAHQRYASSSSKQGPPSPINPGFYPVVAVTSPRSSPAAKHAHVTPFAPGSPRSPRSIGSPKVNDPGSPGSIGITPGSPRGMGIGSPRNSAQGMGVGLPRGSVQGMGIGSPRGSVQGMGVGSPRGSVQGMGIGSPRGSIQGIGVGSPRGSVQGIGIGSPRSAVPSHVLPSGSPRGLLVVPAGATRNGHQAGMPHVSYIHSGSSSPRSPAHHQRSATEQLATKGGLEQRLFSRTGSGRLESNSRPQSPRLSHLRSHSLSLSNSLQSNGSTTSMVTAASASFPGQQTGFAVQPAQYMSVTYQDVHMWLSNLSLDEGKFQEGARSLSQYAVYGDPSTKSKLLVGHDLAVLVKTLDSKKRLCGSKQAAMDTIARFVYLSDTYRTDFLTKGVVGSLVKNLKCDQGRCQLNALTALHALVETGKKGSPSNSDTIIPASFQQPPVEEKKKGVSGLFKKSKLARQVNRLVVGTKVEDMATQVTDAAGVEQLVLMLHGTDNVQNMAVDILLDIGSHDDRIHHLAKRGTVQASVQLLKPSNSHGLQMKGLNLLLLLTQPRPTKMEKGLLESNVDKAFVSNISIPLLQLLHSPVVDLSCKSAEVIAALGNTAEHKGHLARHGNCIQRLLTMLQETPQHKLCALRAIEQLSRDTAGAVQRLMVEGGAIGVLLRLVRPDEPYLAYVMTCVRLLANANEHRLHLIEQGAIHTVLQVTALVSDSHVLTEAATLMWYLTPYQNPDTKQSYVVEGGGTKALIGYLSCPAPDCKAAACRGLTVLADQSDDNKRSIVCEGGLHLLTQLLQSTELDIRGVAAEVLVELADIDDYKLLIAQQGVIRDLVTMLAEDHPEVSINAAARAIEKLCHVDSNRWEVVATSGLPPLVNLLGHSGACGPAVRTLLSIAANKSFLVKIANAKATPWLMKLATDPTSGCDDVATHLLRLLCTMPESLDVVGSTKGCIATLVHILKAEGPSVEMKQDALEAVCDISAQSGYKSQAVSDGVIESIVSLLSNERWPARATAAQVLSNLAVDSEPIQLAVIGAGGLVPLKQMLFHGDDVNKAAAADALGHIALNNPKAQVLVATDGVIPHIVNMLSSTAIYSRLSSTAALYHTTKGHQGNQLEAVASGAIHRVVTFLNQSDEDTCPDIKELRTWSAYAISSLACNNDARREMANLNAVACLADMLKEDVEGANDVSARNAAGIALAALITSVPEIQRAYIHTGTLPVVIGMLGEVESVMPVLVACHLLLACAGNPMLYSSMDVLQTTSLLLELVQSKNPRVQEAAIRTVSKMAESNATAKQQVAQHVSKFAKLLSDKASREGACQTLRVLAETDPEVRSYLLKNKAACKTIQKLMDKSGTVVQDEAIKLWRILAGTGTP